MNKISIPKRLKIGGHWYKIKYPHKFRETYSTYAQHNGVLNEILVGGDDGNGNSLPTSTIVQSLIHEMLHSFERVMKREVFPDKDKTADLVAEAIYMFLVDNGFLKIDENTTIETKGVK